ncbi:P-loop containing nucleoside triphosphate hydrolase protein [Desarmillaria tabescens]|uniref:P-loop containing nucleoside triphosphate hydrolase protein n=1 Tax=Armillaria tabescens TaxID=1929756 RepID=A0AA39JFR7_ARMTA|nr:P-loop containing nucleoside triphosphate hydrolase protein [Desarmillaria tabescens]KAK0441267.1 P-loop containing nucleoside triphosphate hydrolase protein [Desarmillaria tabescens]
MTSFARRFTRRGTTNGTADGIPSPPVPDSPPSEPEDDSTTVPINQTEYARRCREVMELYRALQELGLLRCSADRLFPTLPKIVVIGGQSTGKSSLVEAVSGINVPRDSGTCTRCPMECIMLSSSLTWSCTIYLNFKYASDGSKLDISDRVQFGPVIKNRDMVELWIRRAQAAILCRHRPKEDFMSMSTVDLRNLTTTDSEILPFSRNFVQVELRDPDLTDLSFVDLPGKAVLSFNLCIIHNAEEEIINLVHDLVVSYIEESENTIVLITIPMSDDIEMQAAVKLAKARDPNGDRTIGVLTKPDMLTTGASGARQKWREIILGQDQKHRLKHGYYCVRLPDDDERRRNISREESQAKAKRYFERTSPWKEFPNRSRFGIPALVHDISRLLVGLIENYIPTLKQSVDELLATDKAEYSTLPPLPPTDEAWSRIIILIHQFCVDVKAAVEGKEEHKGLVQRNRARYGQFKRDILGTCPNFRPFEDKTRYLDPCIQDEQFEGKDNPYVHMAASEYIMDIKDVRREIENCTSWELPGEVPLETTRKLIELFTKKWSNPSMQCFDESRRVRHVDGFKPLETRIRALVRAQMEMCKSEALVILGKAVKLETSPVYTQVPQYSMERSKWFKRFYSVYTNPNRHWDYIANPSLLPPVREATEDEEALLVMAKVREYFEIAYKRFIDNIPLTIEHELHQTLLPRLSESLIKDMGGQNASERAKELLTEDPEIAMRRNVLQERIARLEEIKRRLYAFSFNVAMSWLLKKFLKCSSDRSLQLDHDAAFSVRGEITRPAFMSWLIPRESMTAAAPSGRAYPCAPPLGEKAVSLEAVLVLDEMENSWARATPVEARTREVRTYARKVRSEARWSRATEPLFSSVGLIRMAKSK